MRRVRVVRRMAVATVAVMTMSIVMASAAHAGYDPPGKPIDAQTPEQWLLDQVKMAAQDEAKSVGKSVTDKILSGVGGALLNVYMPGLGDLLFGGGDANNAQFQMVVSRLNELEDHLSNDL